VPECPRLLIADDNADILHLVSRRLERRGWTVVTATDGDQARAAIRETRPAAVVLDWVMPGTSGPDLCQELKADPETASVPVILLTARAAEDDLSEGQAAGADGYFTKPFDIKELDAALRRLIEPPG
jgi:DNA-binding response OmpR family regulator